MKERLQKIIAAAGICSRRAAEELLRQTDIPVREIAPRVGYTDANYFTKVFKRHCGCTPTDYRSRL